MSAELLSVPHVSLLHLQDYPHNQDNAKVRYADFAKLRTDICACQRKVLKVTSCAGPHNQSGNNCEQQLLLPDSGAKR